MSYVYSELKPRLFTEEGSVLFTAIRDRVKALCRQAGAVSMGKAISGSCGDSWLMLACVDRLVELGELREVTDPDRVRGQDRIFVERVG